MVSELQNWIIIDPNNVSNLFEEIHPRTTRNAEDEIHDLLKAYYEASTSMSRAQMIPPDKQ